MVVQWWVGGRDEGEGDDEKELRKLQAHTHTHTPAAPPSQQPP